MIVLERIYVSEDKTELNRSTVPVRFLFLSPRLLPTMICLPVT